MKQHENKYFHIRKPDGWQFFGGLLCCALSIWSVISLFELQPFRYDTRITCMGLLFCAVIGGSVGLTSLIVSFYEEEE